MQLSKLKATWPFQALADETRFRMVRLVLSAGTPLTAGQVASALGIPSSHLSRHIHVLEAAGLATIERRGRSHFICIENKGEYIGPLSATVAAMADSSGLLKSDFARLMSLNGLSVQGEVQDSGGTESALLAPSAP